MWSLARCSVYRSDTSIQQRSDLPLVTDLQTHESLRSFKPTLKLVQASALSFLSLPYPADLPRLKLGLSILTWYGILYSDDAYHGATEGYPEGGMERKDVSEQGWCLVPRSPGQP